MQNILIVEDDADLVETYTDLLEMYDCEVTSTPRANDAIVLVSRIRPSIVLLDLNLAGYSGAVMINIIRGYPTLKDTKIVVITGHPEMLQGTRDAARVDMILSKPVSNEKLIDVIRQFSPPVVS